ncbi:MAG TPA: hypothetical protein VHG32_14990 [Thermoanaerobaculia bacterium]|nr:hypothetical protein [Thermoanaerobaculia bacterium]
MKKTFRKITLCRETLCQLEGSALAIPNGGAFTVTGICCSVTCPANTCHCTKTCTHNINQSCTTC